MTIVHDAGLCNSSACDHREPPAGEIIICRAWLREYATPRESFNVRLSSYGLKHDVERASRKDGASYTNVDRQGRSWTAERVYVSNGAFIAAALLEGYRVRPVRDGSPNAFFNARVHKLPLSVRPPELGAQGPAEPLSRADRDTVAALTHAAGSLTAAGRILGVGIGTIDRAVMGRRLRAPTRARIAAVLERIMGARNLHTSSELH